MLRTLSDDIEGCFLGCLFDFDFNAYEYEQSCRICCSDSVCPNEWLGNSVCDLSCIQDGCFRDGDQGDCGGGSPPAWWSDDHIECGDCHAACGLTFAEFDADCHDSCECSLPDHSDCTRDWQCVSTCMGDRAFEQDKVENCLWNCDLRCSPDGAFVLLVTAEFNVSAHFFLVFCRVLFGRLCSGMLCQLHRRPRAAA